MKKTLQIILYRFAIFLLSLFYSFGWGQTTIFYENMYNGTGGTSGDAIATHETNNRFNEDGLTYSGTGDMRTSNASSGYTTVSGASASGSWNVLLNANTETFVISGINTSVYSSLSLSFGIRKSTNAENGSSLAVEVSSDGTSWSPLTLPSLPTGTGTATWYYITCSGSIPSTANLRIRFTSSYGTNTFNIDDVELRGTLAGKTSTGNGDWNNAATWSPVGVPSNTDNVIIQSGHTVFTSTALTRNAVTNVNGTFQLNAGGWASGTNFTYGAGASLNFNNTSSYGVNSGDVFWPTTNGPTNVNVLQGGLTLNAGANRTVTGIFQTAAGVTLNSATLTLSGTGQINAGGFFNNAPTYTSSSTLVYNGVTGYGVNNEWTGNSTTPGTGIPQNVTLTNSSINMPNANRGLAGNLLISASSTLNLNATSGDLYLAGNWTNSGNFNPNNRAVFFNGNTTQTITKAGTETFNYLIVENASSLRLDTGTSVVVNGNNGLTLSTTHASSSIDLNGNTFTLSGGGNLSLSSGNRFITSSVTGGVFRITNATVTVTNVGTLTFGTTANPTFATLVLENGFNAGTEAATTINSILQINASGFVTGNTLRYNANSLLRYNVGGVYNRNFEWNGSVSPIGVPYNVQLSNNTTLNYVNAANLAQQYITNNLTIDNGSSFYMDYGSTTCGGALNIGNNLVSAGNLSLGFASGDDLRIGGNITFNTGYTFDPKGRAVFFTKAGTQTITASSTPTFHYAVFSSPTTVIQLSGTDLNITAPNTGNVISFNATTNVFDINGRTLTLGTPGLANAISGSGTFRGSTTSNLTLLGNGSIGTINMDTSTSARQTLGTFTVNRQASTIAAVLGTPVIVNTSLALTNGHLDMVANTITLSASATVTGGSSNSYVIADKTIGGKFRKSFTSEGTFTYPIGDATSSNSGSQYSPATLNIASGTFTSAYAEVSVDDIKEPNNEATTDFLTRYWSLIGNGITNATYNFSGTYIPATDVVGNEANFLSGRFAVTPATWREGTAITSPTVSITGLTTTSDGALASANEYRFTGGYPFKRAEIDVKQGSTSYPSSGAAYNFGNVGIGSNSDVTFTIENSGLENLTLGAATISGTGYSLLSTYTSPVSAAASTTFVIRFSPTSATTFTGSISIPNNDTTGTENPYIINFTGVGTCNLIDFESASKSSYATDDVVINGKTWQLSEALIGDLTNDYKVGLKSLRIRDDINAKAEMQEDFTAGVSTISFNYRLYTSDTMSAIFKLEISKDAGNSWSQIGGSIVPTSTVQTFNETINQAGPVRFRIVYSGGATTSSLRFNIDNISVCSYDTPQEIEVTGNNTTIHDGSTTILNKNNTNFGSDYFVGDGTIVKSFTVRNLGTGTLTLSNPTISGSTDFTVSTLSNTSLISGDSATFTVSFSSTTVGNKTATISIINNDANENPYTFNVGASVFNYTRCALSSYTVIAQQDFEDSPASPALNYTTTGTTARTGGTGYGDNRTTQTNMFIGTKSFQVTSNNTAEIIFSNVDTSQYQNVNLNFRLGAYGTTTTDGIETGDEVLLSLSTDGGTTWSKQIKIKGSNNSVFDINTASGAPVSLVYDQTSTSEATFGTGFNSTNTFSNSFTITDLPSVPSLRFKINFSFSTNAANTEKIALDNFRLEGQLPLTKTYQNGAWLTGAPAINEKAIIDDNFITGGANGNIIACECQINNGRTLTIAANTSATIESDIINNGNIVVESDGNLLQKNDYASFTGNNILVRRNANLKRLDYNYWGAPVTGQNLRTFSTGTLPSRFYTYNEANDGFVTIDPYNNTFTPAKGYAIRASNTATTTPQVFAGEFRGVPNNGVVAINLAFTDAAHGYNLVANPYPSNIDLDQLYADNSSDITGEFYFWTNINPNPAMQFSNYPQLGFYNNYAVYNASGGVPAASPATCVEGCVADSPTPTNIVKPGQGFIVRATGAARTLDFNNALRRTTPGNFFNRNSNQVKSNDRYWLQLITPLKLVNTILIAYKEGSTKNFEENFDAKLLVQSPDSFYSTVDSNKLIIQGRGYPFNSNDKVNIGASFYQAGVHTISLAKKEGEFSAEQPIYLHDKKLETIVDLQKQEYSFTAEPGETKDRFEIIYNINNRNLTTQENNKYGVLIYEAENHFIVQADKAFDQLKMYDLSGKLLKTIEARKKYLMIEKSQLNKGVIIFSIIFADEMVNKKIISN